MTRIKCGPVWDCCPECLAGAAHGMPMIEYRRGKEVLELCCMCSARMDKEGWSVAEAMDYFREQSPPKQNPHLSDKEVRAPG